MNNQEFNQWLASLPVVKKVVGVMSDGTEVTVSVPSFGRD